MSSFRARRAPLAVAFALAVSLALGPPAHAAGVDREDALQIFNRDVLVLTGATLRNPTAETPSDAQLHNDVGAALPVNWGEWQQATATSMAIEVGGPNAPRTDIRLSLRNLVPNGIYSAFYITLGPDSEHPDCRGVERSLPLTSLHGDRQNPDPSSFVAGPDGSATYHGRVDGALLDADQVIVSIIYHFDRMTYHPFANRGESVTAGENCRSSYGHDALRQLLVFQKL